MTVKPPYVVPSTARRDLAIGLAIGLVAVGLVLFGIVQMSGGIVGKTLTGTVIAKRFTPLPHDEITVGKRGLHAKHLEGDYYIDVRVGEHTYTLLVDPDSYNAKKQGDAMIFMRPPE